MNVDLKAIRPGDEVTIRFIVVDVAEGAWPHVECKPGDLAGGVCDGDYVSAGVAAIVSHTPKALAVGDRVKWRFGPDGTVLAIDQSAVWLTTGDGGHRTVRLSDLERLPPEPRVAATAERVG